MPALSLRAGTKTAMRARRSCVELGGTSRRRRLPQISRQNTAAGMATAAAMIANSQDTTNVIQFFHAHQDSPDPEPTRQCLDVTRSVMANSIGVQPINSGR